MHTYVYKDGYQGSINIDFKGTMRLATGRGSILFRESTVFSRFDLILCGSTPLWFLMLSSILQLKHVDGLAFTVDTL